MNLYIDMGGTYLRYEIDNQLFIEKENNIIILLKKLIQKYHIKKVFISFAGHTQNNIIYSAPNIEIKNLDLKEYFPNIEFIIENDLNCAVLAESNYFNEKNIVAFYIGTGAGSGAIIDGYLIKGINNSALEIGHIPFKKAPFLCGCGKDNCIENFCSGSAIKKWANYLKQDFKTFLDAPQEVKDNFLEALMFATATLITLFNPKILVLGGGVIENNQFLVKYINENIKKYAFNPNLEDILIIKTKLKNAPLHGCKLLNKGEI
jgi:predicted NBD/HSP70 family sugar kinase